MGRTPLILAVLFLLGFLGLGFWANERVADMPPVIQAVIENNPQRLEQAIQDGHDINARGPFGMTALVVAVKQGKPELVRLLVEHHADTDVRVGKLTLIEFAEQQKRVEIAEYLRSLQ